ncbi:bifunctional peptidase and (3S)-lysyl hydroxylase Jmjd7-like [Liolophura sinensis]|uniref:bifunctional peptidase and (3S)-lysyl hydroxylase Jmjd7-like n=1 Tax=Liolophura sinensis TaxID=3198878 RepID=UPI00315991C3
MVDRTCLLTPPTIWSHPTAQKVRSHGKRTEAWVDFINEACHVYRTADGDLSPAGIHRHYILQNLFFVENVTQVNMGCIYRHGKHGECRRNVPVTKNDNSTCKLRAAGFYHSKDHTVDKSKQCDKSEELSKSYSSNVMHEADIAECTKIELPSFSDFFQNHLQKSKPVIIKNAIRSWPAFTKWSNKLLRDLYGESRVHIKLSPSGDYEGVESAEIWEDFETFHIPDIVRSQLPYPDLVVVRPATLDIRFSEFLDLVENVSSGTIRNISAYLEYTSLSEYFEELVEDVQEMPFISGMLNLKHKNIWLSDGNTLGKLHFDPFDNFLCQISGQKEVILFSPHENTKLYEAHIPEALLGFNRNTSTFRRKSLLDSTSMVMSPVDILNPDFERFPEFAYVFPMNCTLGEGDVLYLPAFWWHEVQSRPSPTERRNLALNFWYEPFLTKEFPCAVCKLDVNPVYRHLL